MSVPPPVDGPVPAVQISERFCAVDSDITLQSSDGVLFKVHRKNLEMHSEGFAAADSISGSGSLPEQEIVSLSETSTTLNLLLQYMYRQPQPDLEQVDFGTLARVAEAAEKYQVYAATTVCRILMKQAVPQHPIEVLHYAAIYDYRDLMNYAAPKTIGMDVDNVVATLHPNAVVAWFRYYEAFNKTLRALCQDARWLDSKHSYCRHSGYVPRGQSVECSKKAGISLMILQRLGRGPWALRTPGEVLNIPTECQCCQDDIIKYREEIETRVEQIPHYSTFL